MHSINIHDAKNQFSKLIEAVSRGEEILIAKAGIPVARLVPMLEKKPLRKPGALKGRMRIASDFDAPLPRHLCAAKVSKRCRARTT